MVDAVLSNEGEFDLSIYELSRTHDVRPHVVSTLLTYLELLEIIETTARFTAPINSSCVRTPARFWRDSMRNARVSPRDFGHRGQGTKVVSYRSRNSAKKLNSTRERLVKTFAYLEECGDLT
jgi:ATP-dependent DNA helicase RecQ